MKIFCQKESKRCVTMEALTIYRVLSFVYNADVKIENPFVPISEIQ